MAIRDIILTLKNKEGTLTNNKVCNFAYDDTAYEEDSANGVINYNYNSHNNIPVKDNSVIKVNATVTSKGFRSQVSTLPRMLLNHIFGRVSYNLNKTVDVLNGTLQALYNTIGQANGLATLDSSGRLPYSQLPLSAIEYKGAWNAETNTPTLSSGSGTFGDEYIVSVQGTRNLGEGSVTYRVGDRVIYNGSIWQRIPASSVRSVNTKTPDTNGNVTVNAEDMTTPDIYGYDRRNIGKFWNQLQSVTVDEFYNVKFAEGVWVALKLNDGIYYSSDGETWEQATGTAQLSFLNLEYVNGIWFARNNYDLWTSKTGSTWAKATVPEVPYSQYITDLFYVYFANAWFVFFRGLSSSCLKSTDGVTWTLLTSTLPELTVGGIATNGVNIAVGSSPYGDLYYTNDGVTWNVSETPAIATYRFDYITYANGLFIAKSGSSSALNAIYWSEDGKHWSNTSLSYNITNIVYANGKWVAYESSLSNPCMLYSNNGKEWYEGQALGSVSSIINVNNLWLANTSQNIYFSNDGIHWTLATLASTNARFTDMASSDYKCIAGTYSNGFWQSKGTPTNNVKEILDWLIHAVDNRLD